MADVSRGMRLHNLTFYLARDEIEAVRTFYAERLGLPVVFEEPGHICCFHVGGEMAICLHEAEPGHPAGERELFLWSDEVDGGEVRLTDPAGTKVRVHERRDRGAAGTG
jgi:catechol 2,3-dioxygenase-like lactoylglutathione lyase family enzyme